MCVRCTDKELSPAGDQDVSLLAQAISQFLTRFRRLDVAGDFHVVVLALISACAGDVRQDTFANILALRISSEPLTHHCSTVPIPSGNMPLSGVVA